MKKMSYLMIVVISLSFTGCSSLGVPATTTKNKTAVTTDSFEQSAQDLGNKLSLETQINQLFEANQGTGQFYNPIADYTTKRQTGVFSQYVSNRGYLTGDDIILKGASSATRVFALTDAQVVWKDTLVEYGGTVILAFTVDSVVYHALYSGLDLSTVTVNVGDQVSAGSELGELAGESTRELRFSLYPYTTAELFTMYATIDSDLDHWLDPATFLRNQQAKNPNFITS